MEKLPKDGDSHLLYSKPAFSSEEGITFIEEDRLIDINDHTEAVWCVLGLSTGNLTREEIIHQAQEITGEAVELVQNIVSDLESLQVIHNPTRKYELFHEQTNNPQTYSQHLSHQSLIDYANSDSYIPFEGKTFTLPAATSETSRLARERESVRNFEDTPLTLQQIGEILNGAYSAESGSIPSAGGLYPVRINVVIPNGNDDYEPGYYQYDHTRGALILYNNEVDTRALEYAFNETDLVFSAPALFVVSADLDRQPGKYSNRGYRFTLLEAGHVAQNIHLISQELGLSTLEYGGFKDSPLGQELQLDEQGIDPLVVVAAGHKAPESANTDKDEPFLYILEESLVGDKKPISWCEILPNKADNNYLVRAIAEHGTAGSDTDALAANCSGGADRTDEKAKIKAIAEGYERYMSGNLRIDKVSLASELETKWLDPNLIAPLSMEQADWQGLEVFSRDKPWQWVEGFDLSQSNLVYAPVDLIYYPLEQELLQRKLCAYANSSGVAAHQTEELAIESALLELVERDAIMRGWLSKEPPPRINAKSMPHHWQRKIDHWDGHGYKVDTLDLSRNGVFIVNVTIRNKFNDFPYFTNGCAASLEGYESAIDKAFLEAETGISAAIETTPEVKSAEHTSTPKDHGDFYFNPENKKHLEWMWRGQPIDLPTQSAKTSKQEIIDVYRPVIFKLNDPSSSPLSVVRVISPKLIPINFGYMSDYYTHPEASHLTSKDYNLKIPHYFA